MAVDLAALPGLDEIDEALIIPAEDLAFLTDDELAAYLEALQVCGRLDGEWRMQARQQRAEDACEELMARGEVFEVLYGGAAAGGKSEWLLYHLYQLAQRFPGFNAMLLRTSFPELNRTAILRSHGRFDQDICKYHATDKCWIFNNGSRIWFGYVEHPRDVFQYDSFEADVFAFDELTQHPTDFAYRYLFSRLRTTISKSIRGLTPHMISATNPHRVGALWVKERFINIGPEETVHEVPMDLGDDTGADVSDIDDRVVLRTFIPAKLDDNRYVNKRAYRQSLAQLDAATRKALEDGNWDVIEGAYFTEWDRRLHVVAPFEIPDHWGIIGGYDFGLAAPFAYLEAAIDEDGGLWIVRECYGPGLTISEQAAQIKRSPYLPRVQYRVGDPSIWNRSGAGPPIGIQFSVDHQITMRKANNTRVDGWVRLRGYLKPSIRVDDPDNPGQVIMLPRLRIFSTCTNLIKTLPMLVHDEKNPEDVDSDGEDHAPDALRYLVMSRPLRTQGIEDERPKSREERHYELYRQRLADGSRGQEHPVLGEGW